MGGGAHSGGGGTVLSDRDRQVLAAMERSLAAQDPAPESPLDRDAPGTPGGGRGSRWVGVVRGVLAGVVAPVVVLTTVPAIPAVVIVIVLALVGRVVAMCAVDDVPPS